MPSLGFCGVCLHTPQKGVCLHFTTKAMTYSLWTCCTWFNLFNLLHGSLYATAPQTHEALQVYRQIKRLIQSWKHPTDATIPMYYTVSWDWRRDLWTEAPRILKALKRVYTATGCKAILAGHSFGGRMVYTVLAVCSIASSSLCTCFLPGRPSEPISKIFFRGPHSTIAL
jgi:hypothetical protein